MARNKTSSKKGMLIKADNERKRAPVWVFAKTSRKVRGSPKSNRNWKNSNLF